jgi:RimJ/RimL family protein N-acetyltransferase
MTSIGTMSTGSVLGLIHSWKQTGGVIATTEGVRLRIVAVAGEAQRVSQDAESMTVWRNRYPEAWMTVFESTVDRTRAWLERRYAAADDDLIVMLEDEASGTAFGHLSLVELDQRQIGWSCELSRVVRGSATGPRGGMQIGALALMQWATHTLDVRHFHLKVFEDNVRAHRLYLACGFRDTDRIGLARADTPDGYEWIPAPLARSERVSIQMEREADAPAQTVGSQQTIASAEPSS